MYVCYYLHVRSVDFSSLLSFLILKSYQEMWPWMNNILPENAAEICSGRLFISITELTIWGPRNRMISEFTSKYDLFEACLASSTIPFVTERHGLRKYRDMWVIDGGVTSNTPVFQDDIRRQLVFKVITLIDKTKLLVKLSSSTFEAIRCGLSSSLAYKPKRYLAT